MTDKQKTPVDDAALDLDKKTNRQLLQLLADLRGLDKHPAWVYIKQVLQSQADMRYDAVGRSPLRSVDHVLLAAELRGEAMANEILASLVEYLISQLEVFIESRGIGDEDDGS